MRNIFTVVKCIQPNRHYLHIPYILIDFSLTVKAATLIFISGRGSAISPAKLGQSGLFEVIRCLDRAHVHVFHENPNRIQTELTCIYF